MLARRFVALSRHIFVDFKPACALFRVKNVLDVHECERFFDILNSFHLEEIRRSALVSLIGKLLEGHHELLHYFTHVYLGNDGGAHNSDSKK